MKRGIFLLLFFLLAACVRADPMTIMPSNGDRLVVQTHRVGWPWYTWPTYVVSASGEGEIEWALPAGLGDQPEWSPDGQWIVYRIGNKGIFSLWGEDSDIYIMKADGSRRVKLIDHNEYGSSDQATWSPDGKRIAFFGAKKQGIYVVDTDCILIGGECKSSATFLVKGLYPDWSPDGRQIVYFRYDTIASLHRIMAIDVETLEIKTITPLDSVDNNLYPDWSPDGKLIAFDCGDYICTIRSDGTDMKRLTSPGGFPVWSKDGKKIAFISSRGDLGKCLNGGGCGEVGMYSNAMFVMNSDGSDVTRLSWHNDEDVEWFAWLP